MGGEDGKSHENESGDEEGPPAVDAKIIFGFDDERVEGSYGQEGGGADEEAPQIVGGKEIHCCMRLCNGLECVFYAEGELPRTASLHEAAAEGVKVKGGVLGIGEVLRIEKATDGATGEADAAVDCGGAGGGARSANRG